MLRLLLSQPSLKFTVHYSRRPCWHWHSTPKHVCLGSLADIRAPSADVRFTPESGHAQRRNRCPLCARSRRSRRALGLRLFFWQARLHEIEGVAVEYCGVSEGITQSPRLHSYRRIDLQHFLHFASSVGQAAKAHVGDGQEQVGVVEFGLRQRLRGLRKSL